MVVICPNISLNNVLHVDAWDFACFRWLKWRAKEANEVLFFLGKDVFGYWMIRFGWLDDAGITEMVSMMFIWNSFRLGNCIIFYFRFFIFIFEKELIIGIIEMKKCYVMNSLRKRKRIWKFMLHFQSTFLSISYPMTDESFKK